MGEVVGFAVGCVVGAFEVTAEGAPVTGIDIESVFVTILALGATELHVYMNRRGFVTVPQLKPTVLNCSVVTPLLAGKTTFD